MLSDPNDGENRSRHKFLANYNDNTFHWVPIDGIIGGGGLEVDDASITTNTEHGAVTSGLASIYGFANASTDTVPFKNNENNIVWRSACDVVSGEGIKIEKSDGVATISLAYEDSGYSTITFVSDIVWDGNTHTLKMKKTTCMAKVISVSGETESTVFTAASHAAEHPGE